MPKTPEIFVDPDRRYGFVERSEYADFFSKDPKSVLSALATEPRLLSQMKSDRRHALGFFRQALEEDAVDHHIQLIDAVHSALDVATIDYQRHRHKLTPLPSISLDMERPAWLALEDVVSRIFRLENEAHRAEAQAVISSAVFGESVVLPRAEPSNSGGLRIIAPSSSTISTMTGVIHEFAHCLAENAMGKDPLFSESLALIVEELAGRLLLGDSEAAAWRDYCRRVDKSNALFFMIEMEARPHSLEFDEAITALFRPSLYVKPGYQTIFSLASLTRTAFFEGKSFPDNPLSKRIELNLERICPLLRP